MNEQELHNLLGDSPDENEVTLDDTLDDLSEAGNWLGGIVVIVGVGIFIWSQR